MVVLYSVSKTHSAAAEGCCVGAEHALEQTKHGGFRVQSLRQAGLVLHRDALDIS